MKLATFSLSGESGHLRLGVLTARGLLDIAHALSIAGPMDALPQSMKELLTLGGPGLRMVSGVVDLANGPDAEMYSDALFDPEEVKFAPVIPDAEKFLCVGKNYRTHLAELQRTGLIKELPEEPTGFIKLNSCLAGHRAGVVIPPTVTQLDYEPELVFVIGKRAFEVKAENAFEHVVGITILNDLTCRETQKREVASGSRFWTAKNAPGFGPLGPYLITMDEVPDPYDIWVTCTVNGEERMRVNTSEQIWKIPRILEHFSRLVPLEPGDMFSTGAPGGVAVGKENSAALFLKPGDVVECAFDAPRMVLSTTIVSPA